MGIKRAIAMRCSQQQFDAVKNQLVNVVSMTNFGNSDYLVNSYTGDKTTNLNLTLAKVWAEDVYDTWNADVFLEACGIETTWKSDELEFFNKYTEKWITLGDGTTDIRVKPIDEQLTLQNEIVSKTGINIVTCGCCGSPVLHRIGNNIIQCPSCDHKGEPCDFPDLNY